MSQATISAKARTRARSAGSGGSSGGSGRVSSRYSMIASDWVSDPAVVFERRHQPLRVDAQIFGPLLVVASQMDRNALVGAAPSD